MKLNLGCGTSRLEDFINIDIDPNVKPDQCFDFTGRWPYEDESVDEIVMYHVIEHIQKVKHNNLFAECYRTLKRDGKLTLTFPEFLVCAEYWKENKRGQREFWEATIFGRQASPHDYHVCLMNRDLTVRTLINHGFRIIFSGPEPIEEYNSVIKAEKDHKFTYEDALRNAIGV